MEVTADARAWQGTPVKGPGRGLSRLLQARSLADLPPVLGPAVSAGAVTAAALIVLFALQGNYYDSMFVLAVSDAIVVLGMAVQVGYSHQLAFSQSVFMGLGAYGVGVLNVKYAWPVWVATIVMVLAASVVGGLIGAVVTRVPGFALALATLFFAVIVFGYVDFSTYLGGSTGIGGIAAIWPGSSFTATLEQSGVVAVVLLGLAFFVCARIIKSGIGLELALLGSDEGMAQSVGIVTPRRKLELFVLGSALAALGGAVFAGTQAFISPPSFDQTAELTLLIMLFIGGRRSLFGALIGAIGIEYLAGTSNWVASNLQIIEGVLFTLILLFAPDGAIDLLRQAARIVVRAVVSGRGRARSDAASIATAGSQWLVAGKDPATEGLEASEVAAPTRGGVGVQAMTRVHVGGGASSDAGPPAQLACQNVTKRFGGVVAVDDVNLMVNGLGIHAICGPNGAGKSTLFEIISGGIQANEGVVSIFGTDVTGLPAYERAQLGVARTLQSVRLMNGRTVLDNVAVAALGSHRTLLPRAVFRSELVEAFAKAREAIERVGIGHLTMARPGALTLEGQRMVELARALVARPRLLLLDEPASGLSVDQRGRLADTLVGLGEEMTIILVEHDLQLVARIAKEVFVLVDGRLEFQGGGDAFLRSSVVRTELMGLMEEEEGRPLTGVDR